MRNTLARLVITTALLITGPTACGHADDNSWLVGTWTRASNDGPINTITFAANGTVAVSRPDPNSWNIYCRCQPKILHEDGVYKSLSKGMISLQYGNTDGPHDFRIETLDNKRMTLTLVDGTGETFKRV